MSGNSAQDMLSRLATDSASRAQVLHMLIGKEQGQAMSAIDQILGGAGGNEMPAAVKEAFGKIREETNTGFGAEKRSNDEALRYLMKTSGADISRGQLQQVMADETNVLEGARRESLAQLKLQETEAGMGTTRTLIDMLLGQGRQAFGLANAGNQLAVNTLGPLANKPSAGEGALGGALTGAASGASFGWPGLLVGGIAGGAMGYFGSR